MSVPMTTSIDVLRKAIAHVMPEKDYEALQGGPLLKAAADAFWVWSEIEDLETIPYWVTNAIADGVVLGKGGFLEHHAL